jgi:hypothetical protein
MAARTLPISSTAQRRNRLLAGCALAAASVALLQAWAGDAQGQVVSVSVPRVSIQVPRVSVQVPRVTVHVPNITVDIHQTTAAIGQTVSQVASGVGASVPNVGARVADILASVGAPGAPSVDLPDVASQIAANTAAAVTAGLGNVQGAINGNHGLAALVGPGSPTADVLAHTGAITVASGTVHTVDFYGDGLINFAVDGPVAPAAGSRGSPVTNGGAITLSAAAASSIVDRAINMQGVAQTQAITVHDGAVALVVDPAAAPGRGPAVEVRVDPLAAVLADADFRPGGQTTRVAIRYGEREPAPDRGGSGWSGDGSQFFGVVETGGEASVSVAASVLPEPEMQSALLTATGEPEQEEELAEALTVLAQIDTLVGDEELAPMDVCQSAGGGGVGLPGCGAAEAFGAVVSLEPDTTGEGCALLGGGGGIRLQCGGGAEALPPLSAPGLDPSVTLQDLMDQWLVPAGPATVHPSGGLLASTASAGLSLN